MNDATQYFAARYPFAWFPMFMWAVWAMALIPHQVEARATAERTQPRPEAANVVDLEMYRQRMRPRQHQHQQSAGSSRSPHRMTFPTL